MEIAINTLKQMVSVYFVPIRELISRQMCLSEAAHLTYLVRFVELQSVCETDL